MQYYSILNFCIIARTELDGALTEDVRQPFSMCWLDMLWYTYTHVPIKFSLIVTVVLCVDFLSLGIPTLDWSPA